MMTLEEFDHALDHWGASLARWPEAEAERARELLRSLPEAPARLDAAVRVDAFLESLQQHHAPEHLAARIAARIPAPDRMQGALDWLGARLWRPVMLGLIVACCGFVAGALDGDPLDPELVDQMTTLAFDDLYAEVDDARP